MYFAQLHMVIDILYHNPRLNLDELGEKIIEKYGSNFTTILLARQDNREEMLKGMFLDKMLSVEEENGKYVLDKNATLHMKDDMYNGVIKNYIEKQNKLPKNKISGD